MLALDEGPHPLSALAAQQTAENAQRSLYECLLQLRIRGSCIRHIRFGALGEPIPEAPNACAFFIPLRKDTKAFARDMRPTALWVICSYEDRILVLASGSNAWEFRRLELAAALEKVKEVLATW